MIMLGLRNPRKKERKGKFGRKIKSSRKPWLLRSGIVFASPEFMHPPKNGEIALQTPRTEFLW